MAESSVDKMIEQVERNGGNWKPEALAIVDINFDLWGEKGSVPKEFIAYYKMFPLSEMHVGDTIHNNNSFLMKVTEKTGVIVVMEDPHIARLAAINLKGRINALSEFYALEKFIKVKDKSQEKIEKMSNKEKEMW
ncbi:MAG: hypothetical protein WED07_16205 [Candidatus Freyarchaeum deiterrae]